MIRVAQISDIHLLPKISSKFFSFDSTISLRKVIKQILIVSPLPDLIIATGDLVEDGSKEAYIRLKELFREINIPIYVLPGNHDNIDEMRNSLLNDNIHYEAMIKIDKWAFIFVNSQLKGKPYGYISPNELSTLEKNLNGAGELSILIALHHSPKPKCPSTFCGFKNSGELMNLIKKFQSVKGVIAGHAHNAVEVKDDNIVLYIAPSTFAQLIHAKLGDSDDHEDFWKSHKIDGFIHGFRILDLFPEGQINSEIHWVYND